MSDVVESSERITKMRQRGQTFMVVTVTEDLKKRIEEEANERFMSMASLIRLVLADHFGDKNLALLARRRKVDGPPVQ